MLKKQILASQFKRLLWCIESDMLYVSALHLSCSSNESPWMLLHQISELQALTCISVPIWANLSSNCALKSSALLVKRGPEQLQEPQSPALSSPFSAGLLHTVSAPRCTLLPSF